jgi:hypothetical protein
LQRKEHLEVAGIHEAEAILRLQSTKDKVKHKKNRYFITYTLAIFDRHGKYCLDQKLKLMRRPSGTASCIEYLLNQNIANFLSTEGVEYVCVSGM